MSGNKLTNCIGLLWMGSFLLSCSKDTKGFAFSVQDSQDTQNTPVKQCDNPVDDPLLAMEDQAKERGVDIDIPYYQERAECNYVPGGVVAQDLNNDGWVDLLFNNAEGSPWAFQNQNGQFQEHDLQLELFDESRVNLALGAVDLNGDLLPEIVQSGAGFAVYAENLGDFHFGEWQVILDQTEYPRPCYGSFNFGDLDQDQDLDLVLAGVDQAPEEGALVGFDFDEWYASYDILLENKAGEWIVQRELTPWEGKPGFSILQVFTDQDNDGDLDLFSASDRPLEDVFPPIALWRNHGKEDGEFILEDVAPAIGADLLVAAMGLGVNDLNQDGFLDYCISDVKEVLICLLSDGPDYYYDGGASLGLIVDWEKHPRLPDHWYEETDPDAKHTMWSGWSLVMEDLDNDGFLDVASTAGHPPDGGSIAHSLIDPFQPNWFWRGKQQGDSLGFEPLDPEHPFFSEDPHYGMASADLDQDGFRELIVGPAYGRPLIFTNSCGEGNWLEVDLIGKGNNKEAFGARVVVERAGFTDQQEMNNLLTLGQSPSELHFGLGSVEQIDSLTVYWPDGTTTRKEDVSANQFLQIQQENDE